VKRTTARQPTHRQRPAPPAGLVAMFSMVRAGDEDGSASRAFADRFYGVARDVITTLGDGGDRVGELELAMRAMYPDGFDDDDADHSHALEAGFLSGVATAWLLLQNINGGAR
jgi:hypothetical protein